MKRIKQNNTKKYSIPLAMLLLGSLAACGGSGDSSEPPVPTGVPQMGLLAGIPSGSGNQDGAKENSYYSNTHAITGLAVAGNGEIIFSDAGNNKIRKISKNGSISTLAGSGLTQTEILQKFTAGSNYVDGKGNVARFNNPKNLVLDSIGNVYVNDNVNKVIRKIDVAGNVTTFAGTVGQCDVSAIKHPAQFCDLASIAIDSVGNIYTAEGSNSTSNPIKKISPSGEVSTIVAKASINSTLYPSLSVYKEYAYFPVYLGVDMQGVLYAADPNDRVIRKYVNGELILFSGAENKDNSGYVDGSAAEVKFSSNISGAAFDKKNNFYVLDDRRIRKIGANGSVTTALDLSNACSVPYGQTKPVENCWFDNLAVDDNGNFLIQEIEKKPILGFNYIGYSVLRRFSLDGASSVVAGQAPTASLVDGKADAARFSTLGALTVTPSGLVHVWDGGNGVIRFISETGDTGTLGNPQNECDLSGVIIARKNAKIQNLGKCYFNQLATDKNSNIYASTVRSIIKISPSGDVSLFSDLENDPQFKDVLANLRIQGMVVAENGVMYISYSNSDASLVRISAILKITESGKASFFAGSLTAAGHRDGIGGEALFKNPTSLALDSKGNLYILDDAPTVTSNTPGPTLRKITPSGQVTTLAGQANAAPGLVDGNAKQAVFTFSNENWGDNWAWNANLALDKQDNIYITDPEHSVIRKITPAGQVSTFAGQSKIYGFLGGDLPGVINRPTGIAVYKDTLYLSMRNAVAKINLK